MKKTEGLPSKRLVITANHREAHFIESRGIKLRHIILTLTNKKEGLLKSLVRRLGRYRKAPGPSSAFEHHTPLKKIEEQDFVHVIFNMLQKQMEEKKFPEIILLAEPQILGSLRQEIEEHLPHLPIYKSISLDPAHMDLQTLESKIFS